MKDLARSDAAYGGEMMRTHLALGYCDTGRFLALGHANDGESGKNYRDGRGAYPKVPRAVKSIASCRWQGRRSAAKTVIKQRATAIYGRVRRFPNAVQMRAIEHELCCA